MKDYVLELVSKQHNYNAKLNIMREYLQVYILRILHSEGVFRYAAFLGGTALRFLHNLPRFSEDLNFSIQKGKDESLHFTELTQIINRELVAGGYNISMKFSDERNVYYAYVKFQGLMYEANISPLKAQTFSIKLEIDTNPPDGALFETHIITKYFPISFLTYDITSLFAGKLHAIFSRKYTKGRDWYDLLWYMSKFKDLEPNFSFLNNALAQTQKDHISMAKENWREESRKVIERLNIEKVKNDVARFLENHNDVNLLTKENLLNIVR
jgi:predicted nucleotidyltransferase component of viral defense system